MLKCTSLRNFSLMMASEIILCNLRRKIQDRKTFYSVLMQKRLVNSNVVGKSDRRGELGTR